MLDEMYLRKGTQFQLVQMKIIFMITSLKNTVPLIIKACPEITVNDEWLSKEILKWIFQVINTRFFFIRAIVTDNYSANVNVFKILLDKFVVDRLLFASNINDVNKRIFITKQYK